MTLDNVSNPTPVLQVTASHPLPFGRQAFGRQRPMSPDTVALNIAKSIIAHRQEGQDRPIRFYTDRPSTQALVQAKLDALISVGG